MLGNQSFLFFGSAVQENIKQIFDIAFSLQGFHEQGMPFILRLFRCVLLFPCSERMEVIGQHLVASVFFLLVSLLWGRFSYLGSDGWLLSAVIADTKIICQLHGGFFAWQSEQSGNKINCIPVCLASETMETHIHFHARISVIVKWADCHAVTIDTDAVHLCRLSGGNIVFYCFKYIHCIILSGNKKGTRHFRKENGKCLLEFHILFFVLRSFLLRLFLALLLQELHFLRYGVLRFGLLLDCLFRREDFADPVANIFHRL